MESIAKVFIELPKKNAEFFNVGVTVTAAMSKGAHDKLSDAEKKGAK